MKEHKFGGGWTELKLAAIKDYLNFYTSALKNQSFNLHYIDAFAGNGLVTITDSGENRIIDGSAKIALETSPAFYHLHLIDKKISHAKALRVLCGEYQTQSTTVYHGDANRDLLSILNGIDWRNNRAVLFLDPYGLKVKWPTLQAIAQTKAIDLWFLFSISGLYRQTARNYHFVDPDKEAAITQCLGTDEWHNAFYAESSQQDLFGDPAVERVVEWRDLLRYVQDRLRALFCTVSDPLILPPKGAPLFALFFAMNNPRAINLSMKAANHILKKYGNH